MTGKDYIAWAKNTIKLAHASANSPITDQECEDLVFTFLGEFSEEDRQAAVKDVTLRVLQYVGELANCPV